MRRPLPIRSLRAVCGGTLVVALTLRSAHANAQATVPASAASVRDALPAEAKADFDRGADLFKRGDPTAARAAFLSAYSGSGEPRVLFNVAVCEKELGHHASAIAALEKSLASADRALPREYIQRTAEAIETLRRHVATVSVDVSVASAVLRLDGEIVRERQLVIDPGQHVLTASKEGFESAATTFAAKAGEQARVSLVLAPSTSPGTARLSCVGEPTCELRIGSELLGRGSAVVSRSTGSYVVRATVGGRPWAEQRIEMTNGVAVEIALVGRVAQLAHLRITTDRPEDTVSIDGARSGKSGLETELAPGEHRVIIARPGGGSKTIDVLLRENETRDLRVTLDEKKGVSPWWFVAGGVVLAGAATTAIVIATRPTAYEGSGAGTLNPYVVTASVRPGAAR